MAAFSTNKPAQPEFSRDATSIIKLKSQVQLQQLSRVEESQSRAMNNIGGDESIIAFEDGSMMLADKLKIQVETASKQMPMTFHNSQNYAFAKADSRNDAKLLSEWVDDMIGKVFAETSSECFTLYEKFSQVFSLAISEMAR